MKNEFTREKLKNLKILPDEDLVDLLFEMKDTLPRATVDEIVSRGDRVINLLWGIIADEPNRRGDELGGWWAAVHAAFILGAIGGKEVVTPLLMSLRFSHANDCDWVFEALPSMFGHIGPVVLEPLKIFAADRSNDWFIRTVALEGMAAVTINHAKFEQEVFDFIASVLNDQSEDMILRGMAGFILLDFNQQKYEKSLLQFARQDDQMAEANPLYDTTFSEDDVAKAFKSGKRELRNYAKYWLQFYNEQEILERQKRWRREARENSWWGFPFRWWSWWKIRKEINEMKRRLKINEDQKE